MAMVMMRMAMVMMRMAMVVASPGCVRLCLQLRGDRSLLERLQARMGNCAGALAPCTTLYVPVSRGGCDAASARLERLLVAFWCTKVDRKV
eukprot:2422173-Pleurochrysis_carterae.AAC.1